MRFPSIGRLAAPLALACVLTAPSIASARAQNVETPEFVRMLRSILRDGARMGPGSGWFGPGQAQFGWTWLADRDDADQDGAITPAEFRGPAPLFERLDRDRSGAVTAEDCDWSEASPYVRQLRQTQARLASLGLAREGRVAREQWQALFDRAAQGRDEVSLTELARVIEPALRPPPSTPRPQPPAEAPTTPLPPRWAMLQRGLSGFGSLDWLFGKTVPSPEMPTRWTLLWGLATAEIGSPFPGPRVGQPAPPFVLKTQDGRQSISLVESLGRGPVVLIFGSFT